MLRKSLPRNELELITTCIQQQITRQPDVQVEVLHFGLCCLFL